MTFENLLNRFMAWGMMVNPKSEWKFKRYFSEMLKRKRVAIIELNGSMECLIFFFITNDIEPFVNRSMWTCPPDLESGDIIFIDKMACATWTRDLHRAVYKTMTKRFPMAKKAYWIREPNNRRVMLNIGDSHELQRV